MNNNDCKYEGLLERLFLVNKHSGMKLGLKNMLQMSEAFEHPQNRYPCIHIAGTNGKGSVTAKTAKGLEVAGNRVGRYISPHISSFRERITINGSMISEEAVCNYLTALFSLCETRNICATFFELTTMMALLYFADEKVDYAVLETGLGGRLDATNIVTPIISVITSISLDHTEILGCTLEEIAKEKAGIIKPGVRVLLGPRSDPIASLLTCPFVKVEGEFASFEEENCAIAAQVLRSLGVPEVSIATGISHSLPCRMEKIQLAVPIVLDVGHNPDGLSQLFKTLRREYGQKKVRIVFGLSKNKDVDSCLAEIVKNGSEFYLVEATNGRGASVDSLYAKMRDLGVNDRVVHRASSITMGVRSALEASVENEIILITGSFFIMREARAALGIEEECDPMELNEKNSSAISR